MAEPKDEYVRKATAHLRAKGSTHADRRTKRRRTRRENDRWAKYDQRD